MKDNIIPAVRLTLFCALFFSGVYTLSIYGIAQLTPNNGNGEVVMADGKKQHINVAQNFSSDKYFWPRPSAVAYNAAGSGGSNKGISNPEYLAVVKGRIDTFLLKNPGIKASEIPSELVTASGSGIDPDISLQGAKIQVKRIANARKISEQTISQLIKKNTTQPLLGVLGTEKINVLQLNIALDQLQ
ncbi:MAG: K(+)-transporting ATPase subunit C [Flavobacterium sp.]|nr:K(+)-transporting ATPase subunit C [Flavobacterium sp.]